MLAAAGLLTLLIAPPLVALYDVERATVTTAGKETKVPDSDAPSSSARTLLGILLFSAAFAAAVRRLPDDKRAQSECRRASSTGARMAIWCTA